jgi:hypothetical protein
MFDLPELQLNPQLVERRTSIGRVDETSLAPECYGIGDDGDVSDSNQVFYNLRLLATAVCSKLLCCAAFPLFEGWFSHFSSRIF